MKISESGLDLIKKHEGLRLKAYRCPAGVWTIGYGSTSGVTEGMEITEEQADERLRKDVETAERCVNASVRGAITQGQFDSLISWVFNLGCGNFRKSTLLRHVNDGNDMSAALEFGKWIHGGGKRLPGLVARRQDEMEMFLA